jgi:hypothetical protein
VEEDSIADRNLTTEQNQSKHDNYFVGPLPIFSEAANEPEDIIKYSHT